MDITIVIDTSDEAMVGGWGWDEYDQNASIDTFLNLVLNRVKTTFPNADITISGDTSIYTTTIQTDEDWTRNEEVTDIIRNIISDIHSEGEWYVD